MSHDESDSLIDFAKKQAMAPLLEKEVQVRAYELYENTGGDKVLLFRIGWRPRAKSWLGLPIPCPVAAGLVTSGVVDDEGRI